MKKPIPGVISLVKFLVYGVIGLAVLAVIAAFVVPPLLDWNDYKADIADAVREATGRELVIDGDIEVSLLPSPEASVSGVHLSNPGGSEAGEMLTLASASAEMALWPLLSGDVEVESLTLSGADITLETAADGSTNWTFDGRDGPDEANVGDGGGFDLSLDSFTIEDSRIRYLEDGEVVAAVSAIDAELSMESLMGPFAAVGTAEVNGLPVGFDIGAGALDTAPEVAVRVTSEVGGGEVAISGTLEDGGFAGTVVLAAENGRALAEAAGLDGAVIPAGKVSVYTALSVSAIETAAEQLAVTVGESRLSGRARFTEGAAGEGASFDIALAGDRLDLDAVGVGDTAGTDDASADGATTSFALPEGLEGTVSLDLGAIVFNGDTIQDLSLSATLAEGALSLDEAAMTLPGESRVSVEGTLSARDGAPHFAGRADVSSPGLRRLLAWLGVDVAGMPDGALQSLSLGSGIEGGPGAIRLDGFSLTLDQSQAAGSASFALSGKPTIALTATVDQLDVDRYAGGGGGGEGGGNPLDAVDATVDLSFGTLTIGGNAYESVAAAGAVQGGALTIDRLSGSGPGGTAFALSGAVSDPAAPAFDLTFDVSHPNLQRLLATFGLDGAGLPAAPVSAAGSAQADGSQLTISGLRAAIGGSDIGGSISAALRERVRIDAQLSSDRLDLAEVFPTDGGSGGGGARWSTEPIDLAALRGVDGTVSWTIGQLAVAPMGMQNARMEATLADGVLTITDLAGSIGGGSVSISGSVDANQGLGLALSVRADGVTFDPGVIAIGGVSIDGAQIDFSLDVTGNGASMADIMSSLNGSASLAVGGGVINGLNLGAWRDAINGLRGGLAGGVAGLQGVLGPLTSGFDQGLAGGQTSIGALTGTFQITNGQVASNDLRLATDVAIIELDGAVSLPAWSIGSLGLASLQQLVFDNVPSIPFRLGGTLDNPTFTPDFAALQVFLGTNVMGLSLDQLPTDLLSGLPIEALGGQGLQGLDPQTLIDTLSGEGAFGPDALQELLGGGEGGEGPLTDPGALIEGLTGQGGETGLPDPGGVLDDLLGGGAEPADGAADAPAPTGSEGEALQGEAEVDEPVAPDAADDADGQVDTPEVDAAPAEEPADEGAGEAQGQAAEEPQADGDGADGPAETEEGAADHGNMPAETSDESVPPEADGDAADVPAETEEEAPDQPGDVPAAGTDEPVSPEGDAAPADEAAPDATDAEEAAGEAPPTTEEEPVDVPLADTPEPSGEAIAPEGEAASEPAAEEAPPEEEGADAEATTAEPVPAEGDGAEATPVDDAVVPPDDTAAEEPVAGEPAGQDAGEDTAPEAAPEETGDATPPADEDGTDEVPAESAVPAEETPEAVESPAPAAAEDAETVETEADAPAEEIVPAEEGSVDPEAAVEELLEDAEGAADDVGDAVEDVLQSF